VNIKVIPHSSATVILKRSEDREIRRFAALKMLSPGWLYPLSRYSGGLCINSPFGG
jgi:hypothetical protein